MFLTRSLNSRPFNCLFLITAESWIPYVLCTFYSRSRRQSRKKNSFWPKSGDVLLKITLLVTELKVYCLKTSAIQRIIDKCDECNKCPLLDDSPSIAQTRRMCSSLFVHCRPFEYTHIMTFSIFASVIIAWW